MSIVKNEFYFCLKNHNFLITNIYIKYYILVYQESSSYNNSYTFCLKKIKIKNKFQSIGIDHNIVQQINIKQQ
jgi:hypothetical protein